MTIEEKLETKIVSEFGSIAEFARQSGVNDSTIRSILRRGIKKAHIDTIFPLTRSLGIDAEKLYHGEIVSLEEIDRDLYHVVEEFKKKLNAKTYRMGNRLVRKDEIEEICDELDFALTRISKRYK